MRTGSVGFIFSSTPLKSVTSKFIPKQEEAILPIVVEEIESIPVSPIVEEAVPIEVQIPSSVPEELHPLAKVNMDFLKGVNMDVKQESLIQQINYITLFKEGVDILFHNLEFILNFSPFVNIKTNFRDNIKFITTTQNTDYTYVLSPLKLIDHILLSNRIATHLQNAGKTQFTETEVVQLCTTLWAPVNVLAGDCLSTIHNITAFYTRETLNMKSLNLDNLLNAATNLNKRTTSEMSASLTEIMTTYASLLNYEKLLQQNYTEFIHVLNNTGLKTQHQNVKAVEIIPEPEKKPSFIKTFITDKIVPYAKTTGESLVSDLTERILDLEDMNNVSGSTIWVWTTELLATEVNNLVTKSDTMITDKATSLLITYVDAAGLDKFTTNFAKQAVRKTIPVMHQKIKTQLTNIIMRSKEKSVASVVAPVVDIDAIANLMTLKCAEIEDCIIEPAFSDNILANGIMSICLTVKHHNNTEILPIDIEMKADNSSTVIISSTGNGIFTIANTVAETVNIKAIYNNKQIATATVKFIQPKPATELCDASFFNNILNINIKNAINMELSISYPFKISNTKSSIITESKITDSEGYVNFYSFPENTQFTITINGNTYVGNTNSAMISIKPETIQNVKPEAVKPEAVIEQAHETVIEQAQEPIIEQAQEPIIEQAQEPVIEQAQETVIEEAQEPVIEQAQEPVIEQAQEPVIEQTIEIV